MLVVKLGLDVVGDVTVLLKLLQGCFGKTYSVRLHIIGHVHIPDGRGLHDLRFLYLLWGEVNFLDVYEECNGTLHGVDQFCGVVDFVCTEEDTRTEIGLEDLLHDHLGPLLIDYKSATVRLLPICVQVDQVGQQPGVFSFYPNLAVDQRVAESVSVGLKFPALVIVDELLLNFSDLIALR